MEPLTRLLLVGAIVVAGWLHYSNAECPDGYFACHLDCCKNRVHFCNHHEDQRRCQECELRKGECGTPNVHEHCFSYCDQLLAASKAVAGNCTIPVSVLEPTTKAVIGVLAVLVFIIVPSCVIVTCALGKRQNVLATWCRRLLRLHDKRQTGLEDSRTSCTCRGEKDKSPSSEDHSLRERELLMDSDQPAAETISDKTMLNFLDKRHSDITLASRRGSATPEVGEISDPVHEQSAVEESASQQRGASSGDISTGSSDGRGHGSTSSFSSAGTGSDSEGAVSGMRPGNDTQAPRRENPRGGDGGGNSTRPSADRHNRDQRMTQTNHTHITIYPPGSHATTARDIKVSTPAYTQSGAPAEGASSAQATRPHASPLRDPRLYTNPSKPANGEHDKVELATGVGNPTLQYPHLQTPRT